MERPKNDVPPSQIRSEGESRTLTTESYPERFSLTDSNQLQRQKSGDPELMEALKQLVPARWAWLPAGGLSPETAPGNSVLAESSLVTRYRERTTLNVPELPLRQRQEEPPEPEPEPEPDLSEEARFQQDLETTLLQLGTLIRNRQHEEAFALAEARRRDFEGEPDFDLLYGRAALNRGAYQRAGFALERSLIMYPDQPSVRLTLVEAYLGLGNTRAAGRQLERAREDELTPAQQRRWETLEAIRRSLVLRSQITETRSVSAQGFYNTNVNQGVACSVCDLTSNFSYQPDDDSQAQGGAGVSLQGRYDRVAPVSQRESRTFQAGLNGRFTTYGEANSLGGLLSLGREWSSGRRISGQLLPGWSPNRLSLTAALNGGIDDIHETRDLTTSVSVMADDQASQSLQLNSGIADDWQWPDNDEISGRWQLNGLANLGNASNQHYLGFSASLTPAWTPPGNWVYQGVLSYQVQQYLDNETFENDLQRNHQFRLDATALRPLNEATQLSVNASWQQVFSNQALAEYRALELAVGVQHRW